VIFADYEFLDTQHQPKGAVHLGPSRLFGTVHTFSVLFPVLMVPLPKPIRFSR